MSEMNQHIQPVQQNALTSIWHFTRHFLEMCLSMCLGFMILGGLFLVVFRAIGYSNPINQLPELSVLIGALNMTVPMAAWMRYRGMAWRPTIEMSAAMLIEAIVLISLGWLNILPISSLFLLQHILMMPAMLIPMLFRLDVYTGRACHSM